MTYPKNTRLRNTRKRSSSSYGGGDIAFFGCAVFFVLISVGIPVGFLVVFWHFVTKFW